VVQRRRRLLDVQAILDAALALIDEEGRLTMAELAGRLGVSASSIYHHVPNRTAIIELIREELIEDLTVPRADPAEWARVIADWLGEYRQRMAQHPRLIPMLTDQTVTSDAALLGYDEVVGLLRAAGFRSGELLLWVSVLDNFALGSALDLAAPDDVWRSDRPDTPQLDHALAHSPRGTERADAAFDLGLRALLDGMAQHLLAEAATAEP
jgi:AcrR family transcriptional regulator